MSSQSTPEPTPTTFVVLGATGDLTARLLLPGLGSLMSVDPARRVRLVGVGRDAWDDERWRTLIREALTAAGVDAEAVDTTTELAVYHALDVTSHEDLERLSELTPAWATWHFALPPEITIAAFDELCSIDLPEDLFVALEKPFGTDERSARSLNDLLHQLVGEERIFRVDHFLGEAMVLNILGLRFANRLFEPVWSAKDVERVEIIAEETLALEGRAGYYDGSGALVDMLQNRLIAIFAMVAMEEPTSIDATELTT